MRLTLDKFMAALPLPEVYRVGGSVRDELLGRQAKDSDYVVRGAGLNLIKDALVATGAKVTKLQTRDGTIIGQRAHVRGLGLLEIVLPRTEVKRPPRAGENQHQAFTTVIDPNLSLVADAVRRDFTINALYRDVRRGIIIDPLEQGLRDVRGKKIRITYSRSFTDDPLRQLRAIRFISKLGFDLSDNTYLAMLTEHEAVTGLTDKGVSGTALDELSGALMGLFVGKAMRVARDTGVLATLLPELRPMLGFEQRSRYHSKTTDEHTFDALQAAANMRADAPLRVRMALLFHDSGKPAVAWEGADGFDHYYANPDASPLAAQSRSHEDVGAELARKALVRLNAPGGLRRDAVMLIERHMLPLHQNVKPFKVRKWRAELGDALLRDLFVHRLADVIGKDAVQDDPSPVEVLTWMESVRADAKRKGVPTSAKGLAIDGHDLMALGLEGRDIGRVQAELLHDVLAQPKLNERDWLLKRAKGLK